MDCKIKDFRLTGRRLIVEMFRDFHCWHRSSYKTVQSFHFYFFEVCESLSSRTRRFTVLMVIVILTNAFVCSVCYLPIGGFRISTDYYLWCFGIQSTVVTLTTASTRITNHWVISSYWRWQMIFALVARSSTWSQITVHCKPKHRRN